MMRRVEMVVCILMVAAVFLVSGCAGFSHYTTPGGASLGGIVGDVTYPNYVGHQVKFELTGNDFTFLKTIEAEAMSHSILGLVSFGDSGYGQLWKQAAAAGADDIINIKVDTRLFQILGVYASSTTKVTGAAIKYKNR
jgi:hypothetical protein